MWLIFLITLAVVGYLVLKQMKSSSGSSPKALGQSSRSQQRLPVTSQQALPEDTKTLPPGAGVRTGDVQADILEMFKILNLRDSDAPRLAISDAQFDALKNGSDSGLSAPQLEQLADRLRQLLS